MNRNIRREVKVVSHPTDLMAALKDAARKIERGSLEAGRYCSG